MSKEDYTGRDASTERRETGTEAPYVYRWSYADQRAFDQKEKRKRRGALTYAVVMTLVFLCCFALLALVILWGGGQGGTDGGATGGGLPPTAQTTGEKSATQIYDEVSPGTVLIYNATSRKYGTGFFFRSNGYIATNHHVIADEGELEITLYTGETLKATRIASREVEDLAVLKVQGTGYPVLSIGNSDTVRVGESAVVIGNPLGIDGAWTTTKGIVSAVNRAVPVSEALYTAELRMIQTDAAVNQGNSGGPICNAQGEVIGIISRGYLEYDGIGYAIPINDAMVILNAIADRGNADGIKVPFARVRPTMGITCGAIRKGDAFRLGGVEYSAKSDGVIVQTADATYSAGSKLQVGDIIYAIDGKPVSDLDSLTELLYGYDVGDSVTISVWRRGQAIEIRAVLGGYTS